VRRWAPPAGRGISSAFRGPSTILRNRTGRRMPWRWRAPFATTPWLPSSMTAQTERRSPSSRWSWS